MGSTLFFENEKEREQGSNLRRQHLASPTAQVLGAQTTGPVQGSTEIVESVLKRRSFIDALAAMEPKHAYSFL